MLRNNLEGRVDRCPSAHQKFRRTAGGSVASGHPTPAPWTSCSSGVRNRSRPAMCDGRRCWPKKASLGKLLRPLLDLDLDWHADVDNMRSLHPSSPPPQPPSSPAAPYTSTSEELLAALNYFLSLGRRTFRSKSRPFSETIIITPGNALLGTMVRLINQAG